MQKLENNFTEEGMQLLIRAFATISDGVTIYTEDGKNIYTNYAHLSQIGCLENKEEYLEVY